MEPIAGVKIREEPIPQTMEYVKMKCQSSKRVRGQRRCQGGGGTERQPWNDVQKKTALTGTLSHPHHPTNQAHGAPQYQPAGAICIKERSDLHTAEKGEEGKETEDPAHGAGRLMSQLVRAEVRLKRSGAVEDAKAGHHATKGTEDNQPGTQTAFGKNVSVSLVLWSSLLAKYGPIGGSQRRMIGHIER